MAVTVRLAPVLRPAAGGASTLEVPIVAGSPCVLGDVLAWLDKAHPGVGRRVRDEQGAVRRHVNVFVGSDNQRDLEGLATPIADGAEVTILPAVSGGGVG